jgi:hypothetical protein
MIQYQEIYQHNRARQSLRTDRRDAEARLIEFTTAQSAPQQSESNIAEIISTAQAHWTDLVVIHTNQVQFLGGHSRDALETVFPESWLAEYRDWRETSVREFARHEESDQGVCSSIWLYSDCITVPQFQGVYEVATGRRMTRRREIIERFWQQGFAARRGRPLSVAELRWTGNREELTLARELYDQHYLRRYQSDVAKKICQIYTSTVRYYTWPGN